VADNHQYEDRYCAFVDILAFRALLDTRECGKIHTLLSHIHNPFPGTQKTQEHTGYRAQSISDAVAVSTDATDVGLRHLLFALSSLQGLFFLTGVYLRGAIVRGLLFHDEKMVFGVALVEALVEAYRIESTIACFPRIMIAPSVTKDISVSEHEEYFTKTVKASDDGAYLHFLDILDQFTGEPVPQNHVQRRVLDQFIIGAKTLQRNYNASLGNERHFKTLHWLAEYFNNSIHPQCKELPRISGAGLGSPIGDQETPHL
jgi:hypothetical protein